MCIAGARDGAYYRWNRWRSGTAAHTAHLGQSTAESLNTLGDIYINEEIFDLAVEAYSRAMDKNPKGKPDRAVRAAKVMTARAVCPRPRN